MMMADIEFNIIPHKSFDEFKRTGTVKYNYNILKFYIIITYNSKNTIKYIDNDILNLKGKYLYSLPTNDKHKHWTRYIVKDSIKDVESAKKYWSNLKPNMQVNVELDKDGNIINYEITI